MHVTPLDIQQKRFRATWRGLDRAEVDAFLNLVASDVEKLVVEMNRMREEQDRQRRLVDEYRGREQALKDTMITAQRVSEEITANAKKEADIIVGRAELDAEKILEKAQDRLTELLADIGELKRQRVQFLSQLKGVVDTHEKLIQLAESDEQRGRGVEENLSVMRKRDRAPEGESESQGPRPVPHVR